MALISGGGGTTFNGGTITTPLDIAEASPAASLLTITNTTTGAEIDATLDGVGANSQSLLEIAAGGLGLARLKVVDDTKDGLLSFSTYRGVYLQPRSDSANTDIFVEVLDKSGNDALVVEADGKLGFFAHAPAAQQTGVAVTAAGIHAALVALGLITA